MTVVDLFAGPGGWDVGAARLGLHPVGLETDDAACQTRYAAGHATWQQDVAAVTCRQLGRWRGHVEGLIASPPCQDFSAAGNKAGITGDKGELMWQVPRWVDALSPRWVACEQVPPARGFFDLFAHHFRAKGYSTWVGVLNAANHGVPQTRKRVYLLASLDRTVQPPAPTHCKGGRPASMFDDELLPWVSMAEALGWGYDHRTSPTVTGGGSATGGPEPFGHASRTALTAWVVDRRQQKDGEPVPPVPFTEPSPTLDGQVGGKWVLNPGGTDAQPNRRSYSSGEPAPTVAFGHDAGNWKWEATGETCPGCGCGWDDHDAGGYCAGPCGGNVCVREWWEDRPATTIVGSFSPDTVAAPGYCKLGDPPRQNTPGSVKITVQEAAILQGFPPDYPWQGSRSKQFEQIGNAVIPRMAELVLAQVVPLQDQLL